MPRQIITIEVDYNLFASDEETEHELNIQPKDWDIESAFDHYADCSEMWAEFWNNGVRLIQASPPVYTEKDEAEAREHNTTLLELGIVR